MRGNARSHLKGGAPEDVAAPNRLLEVQSHQQAATLIGYNKRRCR